MSGGPRFSVVTLFPEMIEGIFSQGVVAQGQQKTLLSIDTVNPRAFTEDVHKTVDDRPFGGGDGMLMMAEPLAQAVRSVATPNSYVIYLSPQGRQFDNELAREFAKKPHVILVCGRYGGVDQRFINDCVDEEVSIGDYVLSGGELAAAVLIEAAARMIPGVLGHQDSSDQDSFSQGLLEQPSFTRPRLWQQQEVPAMLLSGNHSKIQEWRAQLAEIVTLFKRPDLLTELNEGRYRELKKMWSEISLEEKRALGLETTDFPTYENWSENGSEKSSEKRGPR
jgi:tRNA (guanine37-N1)-methyltransferase